MIDTHWLRRRMQCLDHIKEALDKNKELKEKKISVPFPYAENHEITLKSNREHELFWSGVAVGVATSWRLADKLIEQKK